MTSNTITVNIKERETKSKLQSGYISAVFYGPQEESTPITLNASEFYRIWKEAGESTIVILKGVGDDKEALIKTVQWHPLTDDAVHVDFYVFERGKKLTVSVPLEFVGEAPAEKLGGNVNKAMHEIEMEVRPSELPQYIEVDLTKLVDLSSTITIADLKLPESATTTLDATDAVASVTEATEEDLSAPVGDAMPESEEADESSEDKSDEATESTQE